PTHSSQHLDAHHVDRITAHVSGYGDMMALMPFKGVRILHAINLLIGVADDDRLFARRDAFLGTSRGSSVRAFCPALGIANPAIHGFRFRSFVRKDDSHIEERY